MHLSEQVGPISHKSMQNSQKPIPHHIPDFLDWLEIERGLLTKSQENYARFLHKFISWLKDSNLSSLKPHELTPDHIRQYRLFLSRSPAKPLKKSTQNYYLIALRNLLNYFAERDIVSLPSEKIKLAKNKEDRQVRFLTMEQLQKFFEAPNTSMFQGLRDRAILETFFSTGMRIAELVSLNREQIKISPEMKELELSIKGKGGRIRPVYFSARALGWLQKYLEKRPDMEEALFVSYRGKDKEPHRLTHRAIQKAFKKYAVIAGIPLFTTPHVMRHTFATDLLAQGVDLRTIQEFLGHKSIAATQIYAHVTSQKLKEIHEKFHGGKDLK